MKRIMILLILNFVLMLPIAPFLNAQTELNSNIIKTGSMIAKPVGFLDKLLGSSNFHMSHSYAMEFSTFGSRSMGLGLYTNTITMQLASPLTAQVKIGVMHPISGFANSMMSGTKLFLQQATVKYQSTENMQIRVDYRSYPVSYLSPYYRMW